VVALLAVTTPLVAQENESDLPVLPGDGTRSIDLGILQALPAESHAANNAISPACSPIPCSECIWLDSYNPVNSYKVGVPGSNVVNVSRTAGILAQGVPYVITITGTASYWAVETWESTMIGSPGTAPMFLSPAVPTADQGYTGFDWEYNFGYPNDTHGNFLSSGAIHAVVQGISLDNGATYLDRVPLGGQTYHGGHSYQYLVEGKGKQAAFRITDNGPHSDNYGRYKICIQKLVACGESGATTSGGATY
jgi:hypothetical protein